MQWSCRCTEYTRILVTHTGKSCSYRKYLSDHRKVSRDFPKDGGQRRLWHLGGPSILRLWDKKRACWLCMSSVPGMEHRLGSCTWEQSTLAERRSDEMGGSCGPCIHQSSDVWGRPSCDQRQAAGQTSNDQCPSVQHFFKILLAMILKRIFLNTFYMNISYLLYT